MDYCLSQKENLFFLLFRSRIWNEAEYRNQATHERADDVEEAEGQVD